MPGRTTLQTRCSRAFGMNRSVGGSIHTDGLNVLQPEKNEIFNIFLFCPVSRERRRYSWENYKPGVHLAAENSHRALFIVLLQPLFPSSHCISLCRIARMAIHLGERGRICTSTCMHRCGGSYTPFRIIFFLPFVQSCSFQPVTISHQSERE